MPSIESLGYDIIYKVKRLSPSTTTDKKHIRGEFRALEGMQKEGIIHYRPTGTVWRMACDEGPYLNGTDLSSFPLGFYSAGITFDFMEAILAQAKLKGVAVKGLELTLDHVYTMEGSAVRGDMIGGAKSIEIDVRLTTDSPEEVIKEITKEIIITAQENAVGQTIMRDAMENIFALSLNGEHLKVTSLEASEQPLRAEPESVFEKSIPADGHYESNILEKLTETEAVFGVEGGAGSSLQSEQKRSLHIRSEAKLRDDGLKESKIQLFKPIGSTFKFLSDLDKDQGGEARAPNGMSYLAAGVGFCYMTQIGRYAHIKKLKLNGYKVIQDLWFSHEGNAAKVDPVDTHTYLHMDEAENEAQQTLKMSERTCFLHAAMRAAYPSNISINGKTPDQI